MVWHHTINNHKVDGVGVVWHHSPLWSGLRTTWPCRCKKLLLLYTVITRWFFALWSTESLQRLLPGPTGLNPKNNCTPGPRWSTCSGKSSVISCDYLCTSHIIVIANTKRGSGWGYCWPHEFREIKPVFGWLFFIDYALFVAIVIVLLLFVKVFIVGVAFTVSMFGVLIIAQSIRTGTTVVWAINISITDDGERDTRLQAGSSFGLSGMFAKFGEPGFLFPPSAGNSSSLISWTTSVCGFCFGFGRFLLFRGTLIHHELFLTHEI